MIAKAIREWLATDSFAELLTAVRETVRVHTLNADARAALGAMLASGDPEANGNPTKAAAWAFDYAEAMQAERARRLK